MRKFVLALCCVGFATTAHAAQVSLSLNEDGVVALEKTFDLARKAGTIDDAQLTLALYAALQQAKRAALAQDDQQKIAAEQARKDLEKQLADLKAADQKVRTELEDQINDLKNRLDQSRIAPDGDGGVK